MPVRITGDGSAGAPSPSLKAGTVPDPNIAADGDVHNAGKLGISSASEKRCRPVGVAPDAVSLRYRVNAGHEGKRTRSKAPASYALRQQIRQGKTRIGLSHCPEQGRREGHPSGKERSMSGADDDGKNFWCAARSQEGTLAEEQEETGIAALSVESGWRIQKDAAALV